MADDEAIVFRVEEDKDGNAILRVEENEEIAISIFDQYYNLVEEAEAEKAKKKKTEAKKPAAKTTTTKKKTTPKN